MPNQFYFAIKRISSVTRSFVQIFLLLLSSSTIVLAQGIITGTVLEEGSNNPMEGANVVVKGTRLGAAVDKEGSFRITNVPAGRYTIEVSFTGYEVNSQEEVQVFRGQTAELKFIMKERESSISEIIVTPGHFSVMKSTPGSKLTLSKENIKSTALFGGDIYRAVTSLPGITGNDFSSKFTIRGGEQDEMLVMFDGLELYDPFHQLDAGGVLSIIPVEAIGGVDLLTGGFPSEYGKRKSGIFNIRSSSNSLDKIRTSMGLSFMTGRFFAEGPLKDDGSKWLFSVRRGFADLAFRLTGQSNDILPEYYDILGKLEYNLPGTNTMSFNVLRSSDELRFVDDDENISKSNYANTYAWVNLRSTLWEKLYVQTVVSTGRITSDRTGEIFDIVANFIIPAMQLRDDRSFNFAGIKQDWSYELFKWMLLKTGFDYRGLSAEYSYERAGKEIDDQGPDAFRGASADPSGTELGAYASTRFKVLKPLAFELGVRYDEQSYIGESAVSPRLSASLSITKNMLLKAGWGKFYQSQGINELNIQDNDLRFYDPELSEHKVIGLEYGFSNGISARLEAYRKELSDFRLRFKNIYNTIDVFEELSGSRINYQPESGESEGIEFFLKKEQIGRWTWWGAYSYSRAEDVFNGRNTPKLFDQTHSLDLNVNFRPNNDWQFNAALIYHTGWPFTNVNLGDVEVGSNEIFIRTSSAAYNAERIENYHRLDLRVIRNFQIRDGNLGLFLEFINVYNQKNIRAVEFEVKETVITENVPGVGEVERTEYSLERIEHPWIKFIPSIGITWDR